MKENRFGYYLSIGAGIGIIFGQVIFDNVGLGLSIGAGLAIALASMSPDSDKEE